MISVIVAIHNQLAVNKIFHEFLRRYTHHPFELIIVDNNSTDGSREFFESIGAAVIRNDGNYSYPFCQNQGIHAARYDVLAFLNNDIIVSPDWDKRILAVMERHGLEIATSCGVERLENRFQTRLFRKKWSLIKNAVAVFGCNERALRLMHKIMYGNWEAFTQRRFEKFQTSIREGFVGNTVVMKRSALEKIGMWDERIYAADFDLYFRSKKRNATAGDLKPVHIVLGVFNHHFIRLTLNSSRPAFKDHANLVKLDEKWGKETAQLYKRSLESE
ncbi:MAG: glycosyltransferase family 2 protein [Limisphaerales bacterium]